MSARCWGWIAAGSVVAGALVVLPVTVPSVRAQASLPRGQTVAPAFEGWERNDDGSFNLIFGYMNRNWDEVLDVPIGPDNRIEPGGPDQRQPTHFLPRRNRHVFRVRVPADFGRQELVWTLVTHGETEHAYGTLHPEYYMDDVAIMNNNGAGGPGGGAYNIYDNVRPTLDVEGATTRRVTVGETFVLTARASDDGVPRRRALPPPRLQGMGSAPDSASGLRLSWFVYRGAEEVTFDPPQTKVWEDYRPGGDSPWSPGWAPPPVPADGTWVTRATFQEPGTYILRCLAHDGGLGARHDVTVTVSP